jgi:hypothetical protein
MIGSNKLSIPIVNDTWYIIDFSCTIIENSIQLCIYNNGVLLAKNLFLNTYNDLFYNLSSDQLSWYIGRNMNENINDASPCFIQDLRIYSDKIYEGELSRLTYEHAYIAPSTIIETKKSDIRFDINDYYETCSNLSNYTQYLFTNDYIKYNMISMNSNMFIYNNNISSNIDDDFYIDQKYESNLSVGIKNVTLHSGYNMNWSNALLICKNDGEYYENRIVNKDIVNSKQLTKNVNITNYNFTTDTIYGNNALNFVAFNNQYSLTADDRIIGTYLDLPSSDFEDFDTSNTSISFWYKANANYSNYTTYPSNTFNGLNDSRFFTSMSVNSSNQLLGASFTNVWISGYNTNSNIVNGSTASANGILNSCLYPSWSVDFSTSGITGINIVKIFSNKEDLFINIYLMSNGMLYFIGQNTLGYFNFSTTISTPLLIPRFWNNDEYIVDICISNTNIYFLTNIGKLYGCGNNNFKNISVEIITLYKNPVLLDANLWGNATVNAIGAYSNNLIISTNTHVIRIGSVSTIWHILYALQNIIKIILASSNYFVLLDKYGNYYYNGNKITVPYNETIVSYSAAVSVSTSAVGSVVLTNKGNVYKVNSITTTYTVASHLVTPVWGMNDSVVNVSAAVSYISGTTQYYYTYLTQSGKVYVNGDNMYYQINHSSTATIVNPILLQLPSANFNKITNVTAINAGNIIVMTAPCENYYEFDGNRGDFIKYDAGFRINACGISVSVTTLYQYTVNKHYVNIKVYATNIVDAFKNNYDRWTKLAEDNRVLSYIAGSKQNIQLYFDNNKSYRYYAILIYSNYNINVSDFFTFIQPYYNNTIMSASIDKNNTICIRTDGILISYVIKNSGVEKALSYNVGSDIYNKFNHYTFIYIQNSKTLKLYLNGINIANYNNIPSIAQGLYKNNYIGRMHYIDDISGTYNYLNGTLSDFRIYKSSLNQDDVLTLYRGNKIKNRIGYTNNEIEKAVSVYAVETNNNYYLYNDNEKYNGYLASIMHNYGIIMRFIFKTNNIINVPLFWMGTLNVVNKEIQLNIINGCIYLIIGAFRIRTKKCVYSNIWHSFELYTCIQNDRLVFSLYINNMPQYISVNSGVYLISQNIAYDGSLEPLNNMVSYIGAYNPTYRYNNDYEKGYIITNTYYSSNIISSNINENDLSSNLNKTYLYKYSSNIDIYYNNSNIQHTITEINGNIYLDEGYYNFNIDGCLAGDVFLGIEDIMINVANSYSEVRTTDMPIYLSGYYKFYSRSLRYSDVNENKLNVKYFKRLVHNYDYYTILSPVINYVNIAYDYIDIDVEKLYIPRVVSYSSNVVIIDKDFNMNMNWGNVSSVVMQDFRMYKNSDNITSNLIDGFDTNGYYYNIKYEKYNEIIDVNRWQRTNNYYQFTNGILNRGIYYNEGSVGIGTTSCTASLEIKTGGSLYSIKTNNQIWVNNTIITSSDERIKKNICDINDNDALNKIMLIEPKIYNYIDNNRKKTDIYGFIAQQVEEILPEAVRKEREFIPNIYDISLVSGDILLFSDSMDLYNKVIEGDLLQLIYENGMKTTCNVKKIVNRYTIIIDKELAGCDKVFVYGKEVDDFHILDKNYIYTLNVCATQDLFRQIVEESNLIEMQERMIEELERRVLENNI